jgi:hypothetical protein
VSPGIICFLFRQAIKPGGGEETFRFLRQNLSEFFEVIRKLAESEEKSLTDPGKRFPPGSGPWAGFRRRQNRMSLAAGYA